jgi:hypothetical protein
MFLTFQYHILVPLKLCWYFVGLLTSQPSHLRFEELRQASDVYLISPGKEILMSKEV